MFHELDVVVVRSLQSANRRVDGIDGVKRQPRVGDQGTVVHVLGPRDYIVESVDDAGLTRWLADFVEDELASAPRGWQFTIEEVAPCVWRATALGPGGMRAEATGADATLAMARCLELVVRRSKSTPAG